MVEHMVLLKFSADTPAAARVEVIRRLLELKDEVPGIVEMTAGENFSQRSQGFQVGLLVRFEHREALQPIGQHPKHQAVYKYMESVGLEDIIAVDFERSICWLLDKLIAAV